MSTSIIECSAESQMLILYMQGEEFSRSIDVSQYRLYEDNLVFVIWKWKWVENVDSSGSEAAGNSDDLSQAADRSSDGSLGSDSDEESTITHSVVFKCLGCLKEPRYQEILALAAKRIKEGETVSVTVKKEPTNPVDTPAVLYSTR